MVVFIVIFICVGFICYLFLCIFCFFWVVYFFENYICGSLKLNKLSVFVSWKVFRENCVDICMCMSYVIIIFL